MSPFSRNLLTSVTSIKNLSSLEKIKPVPNKRSLQTFPPSLSVETAGKPKPVVNPVHENDFNFKTFGASRHKIEVEGMMLNWDIVGRGEHVVLMLPGTLGTMQSDFGPIFPKMDTEKYTLVSWDPPGHGKSRPPSRNYSGEHQRTDGHIAARLMEKLGFDKFSIMGWSNGGTSGFLIAADFPSKVKRLVTMGAFAFADLRILNAAKHLLNLENWHQKMLEPLLTTYGKEYFLQTMHDWHDSISDMYHNDGHAGIMESASKVKCPTLIFHGEQDPMSGIEQSKFLKNNIPNSKLVIMPKAGHNMHLRYTDEFLREATQFLES